MALTGKNLIGYQWGAEGSRTIQAVDPATLRQGLPQSWSAFVLRAIAKDPRHRFESAREMRTAIP